jgi:integrase
MVQRQAAAAANGTINRELHIPRRAFSLAVERKQLSGIHLPEFANLREENVREGFFVDAVLSHIKDVDVRDFIAWGFWTGMRRGEISKLTWAAFDRETSTLILPARRRRVKSSQAGPARRLP